MTRDAQIPTYGGALRVGAQPVPPAMATNPQIPDIGGEQAKMFSGAVQGAQQQGLDALKARGEYEDKKASAMLKAQQELQKQIDADRVADAETKALRLQNSLMYDPERGYTTLQGESAINRPDGKSLIQEYGDAYYKGLEQINATLTTPEQKRLFAQRMATKNVQYDEHLMRYHNTQYGKYKQSVYEGSAAVATERAVNNWADDNIRNDALTIVQRSSYETAKYQGLDPQSTSAAVLGATSGFNLAIVTRAVSAGQSRWARDFFRSNQGNFTAADKEKALKFLDEGETEEGAYAAAVKIWADTAPAAADGSQLAAALWQARDEYGDDPKMLKTLEARLRQLGADTKTATQAGLNLAADQAWDYWNNNKAMPPLDIRSRMAPKERRALEDYINRDAAAASETDKIDRSPPDMKFYAEMRALTVSNKNEFIRRMQDEQSECRLKLGSEYNTFVKLYDKALSDTSWQNTRESAVKHALDTQLMEIGLNPDDKGKRAQYGGVLYRFDGVVQREQEDKGRQLTDVELRDLAARFVSDPGTREGWFGGKTRVRIQTEFGYSDIPRAERNNVRQQLEGAGLPSTDDDVLRVWREAVSRGEATRARNVDATFNGSGETATYDPFPTARVRVMIDGVPTVINVSDYRDIPPGEQVLPGAERAKILRELDVQQQAWRLRNE